MTLLLQCSPSHTIRYGRLNINNGNDMTEELLCSVIPESKNKLVHYNSVFVHALLQKHPICQLRGVCMYMSLPHCYNEVITEFKTSMAHMTKSILFMKWFQFSV